VHRTSVKHKGNSLMFYPWTSLHSLDHVHCTNGTVFPGVRQLSKLRIYGSTLRPEASSIATKTDASAFVGSFRQAYGGCTTWSPWTTKIASNCQDPAG